MIRTGTRGGTQANVFVRRPFPTASSERSAANGSFRAFRAFTFGLFEVKDGPYSAGQKRGGSGPVTRVVSGKGGVRRGRGREDRDPGKTGFRVRITRLKNIAGFFLLPVAWVWTVSFLASLRRVTVHHQFWATEDFWFFSLGVVIWLLFFTGCLSVYGEPRGRWLYVLGHEGTHAVWAWLSRGRVSEFKVHRDGGHILTDKPTVLVTLAPYFYPIPCIVLIVMFALVRLFYPLEDAPPLLQNAHFFVTPMGVFFLLFGLAWGFHISFTVWMIRRGQSDLRMHGNFFSLVLIYMGNLAFLSLLLVLSAPGTGFRSFGLELLRNAEDFSEGVWGLLLEACKFGTDLRNGG